MSDSVPDHYPVSLLRGAAGIPDNTGGPGLYGRQERPLDMESHAIRDFVHGLHLNGSSAGGVDKGQCQATGSPGLMVSTLAQCN